MDHEQTGGLAAVDLGSNSFHLIIARLVGGEIVVVDRLREPVRLAAGLRPDKSLDEAAVERALACLERFGQRLRGGGSLDVRAVGTSTLRLARDPGPLLERAEAALGCPIEIISGHEEARLVYLGVAHQLADDAGTRLVVDIGGGSTELILGERFEALESHSLHMGCVGMSRRCFADGVLSRKAMKAAVLDARRELQTLERRFRDIGWRSAVGSSGTIRAAAASLAANGWGDGSITPDGLRDLRRAIVERGRVEHLQLPGLKAERAPVFAGGVAILSAVFDALRLQHMTVATGALREGVLYDQLGRIRHEDVRERTIRVFQERYHVDRGQAARVERTAVAAFDHVRGPWELGERERRFLAWAALLHEIGLAVSYDHHHRHGAYLLSNADMPGFSQADQHLLAALVGTHRRKPRPELLDGLPSKEQRRRACRLVLLLRLAVLFNRGRTPRPAVPAHLEADDEGLTVQLPAAWLERHPLSRADLLDEVRAAAALGLVLRLEPHGRGD